MTPLHWASKQGRADVALMLLDNSADVMAENNVCARFDCDRQQPSMKWTYKISIGSAHPSAFCLCAGRLDAPALRGMEWQSGGGEGTAQESRQN